MNDRIAQLVDSAGSLPREILTQFRIKEVPLYFTFDHEHYYRENVDYSNLDFYIHMKEKPDQVPKTSAPNVYDWLDGFNEMYEKGYNRLIVTTIASRLSASYQNAMQARDLFLESVRDAKVNIFDSRTCACGQAALEIKIAEMIHHKQMQWEDIINRTKELIPKATSLFSVQELTYMKAGGRIGGAVAFLGKLINIKPICEFVDGVVHPIKALRCRNKALEYMANICVSRIKNACNTIIVIQNALCEKDELFLTEKLKQILGQDIHIYHSGVGTSVGSHSGPGSIGIGFLDEEY